ncbi:DUF3418 domain-containing protein [Escherichia coli]
MTKKGRRKNQQAGLPELLASAMSVRLSYQFEPGADADGVTVHIPLPF